MSEADSFDALAALLPFYVNGSLPPEQHARVAAALAQMPELCAELAEVQAVAALVKGGGAELVGHETTAPAARLEKLMARIVKEPLVEEPLVEEPHEEEPSREAVVPIQRAAARSSYSPDNNVRSLPFRHRLFRPPYSMALAAGLAAVAVVQGGLLVSRQAQTDERYASLSGPEQSQRSAGLFTLRLQSSARWGDVLALLDSQNLRIVAGPQDGMIDVAPNASLNPSQIDAMDRALRASPLVVFVGRGS
jgi:anti-sigma factor RsiW